MGKSNSVAAKPAAKKPMANAFAGLGDVLGEGFGDLMKEGDQFANVDMNDILIEKQDRTEFEDEENTIAEMTESIAKHGVFQPVLIRPLPLGATHPYKLVAGERRYIGSRNAGKTTIPSIIREMTDEEERDLQFQENVQRKNLTQLEEAKRIQADLDKLGSVDEVLKKHCKSRAWLSKILSLLTLPEQTKRLVTEKISADMEVIGSVKAIEKVNPQAAKNLVDDLKKTKGKADARDKANAVKEAVKPSKKQKEKTESAKGIVATQPDLTHMEPGPANVVNFAEAKNNAAEQELSGKANSTPPALVPAESLNKIYTQIFEKGAKPKAVLDAMEEEEHYNVESWLETFYLAGRDSKNMSLSVIQGFRKGTFSTDGEGAFALLAFLQGADSAVTHFNLLNVLGLVKE